MSRDTGVRSTNYTPTIIFNLREKDEGGNLLSNLKEDIVQQQAVLKKDIVVLVHGFNNHRGEAETAFQGLRDRQAELINKNQYENFKFKLRDTFWPGDAAWAGVLDKTDFMVYPDAVGTAKESGKVLGEHLLNTNNIQKINFIGHSLGCRVVLETIKYIRSQTSRNIIGKVCLMAAAVPLFMLMRGGRLEQTLFTTENTLNLYSKSDSVLHYAFPPGQTIAKGDEGFFPQALGRNHCNHSKISNGLIAGAGHSHYWGHIGEKHSKERKRAVASNRYIADFFRLGNERLTSSRTLGHKVNETTIRKPKNIRQPTKERNIISRTL